MDISDIISDALLYPLQNIKALVIFVVLGIIAGIIGGESIVDFLLTVFGLNNLVDSGISILEILIFAVVLLLILGYMLDIIKWGINRRVDSPGIDILRQVSNAVKQIIVSAVYFCIPIILYFILGLIFQKWLAWLIFIVIFIAFTFAEVMATCRLAKTERLSDALDIKESVNDFFRIGLSKIVVTIVLLIVIELVITLVTGVVTYYNSTIGGILWGIFGVYVIFFYNRATGLLYSNI